MKIQKTLYRHKIQEYLDSIEGQDINEVTIPFEINEKEVGVLPYLLLMMVTLHRKNNLDVINIEVADKDQFDRFCDSYFGFAVLSTFWKTSNFNFISYKVTRKELYTRNQIFNDKLLNFSNLKMGQALIPFFDHLPIHKGLNPKFYNGDEFLSEPQLENSIYQILSSISRNNKDLVNTQISPIIDQIMAISWELLGNTHEHARTDHLNETILSPNLRGFQGRIISMGIKNLVNYAKDDNALIQYYNSIIAENQIGNFLELSYFDTGPGIIKRYHGSLFNESISIVENAKILEETLNKGNSSQSGRLKTHKGFGLDRVLSILSEKSGFLKIRTGNLDVYRDLKSNQYNEGTALFDVALMSNSKYTSCSNLEGTLITLLIPLNQ